MNDADEFAKSFKGLCWGEEEEEEEVWGKGEKNRLGRKDKKK